MLLDSLLSSCLLLLASGSCAYVTGKWAANNVIKHEPQTISACIGVAAINLRSLLNLFSPFIFHASYSADPIEILNEEKHTAELRIGPLHEKICRVFGMAGLIFAVCDAHGNRQTGIFIISTLTLIEFHHALYESYPGKQRNKLFHFMWMLAAGFYGWIKNNKLCFWAHLPYGMSFLLLTPEKHYAWSVNRTVNNYMMMVHVFLMLEAIRDAQSNTLK
ncbi:uncharacterized protein LOC131668398 [Phymastichus coffea]|uniref:uncharacterized protein LOC131668398 n=1 Tax=Phymastichus coffea TaxID=108790 RepID=UPI00273B8A96|nr:uncharacterized protein LOC131668398 [Phymastichus coffea]